MSVDVLQSLVRPSENLHRLLNVHLASPNAGGPPGRIDPPLRRGLIAILTHRDRSQQTELGCLLVLDLSATSRLVRVVDALPITQHLALEVAQTGPLDTLTEQGDPGVRAGLSAWLLVIKHDPQDTPPVTSVVRPRDIQHLQSLATEFRRLKEIATATHPIGTDFAWVGPYLLDPSPRCLDLRIRGQPLHARLSPAVAGLPGDDVSDISVVRGHWIEQAAVKRTSDGSVKHLKIRLGTFNVNGRIPSQDLYPWLRCPEPKDNAEHGWISPLKFSPFDVSSNPFHQELRQGNTSAEKINKQSFGEPDMLVLGFQELDLSTEALLYTTSTLKENAWLTAIFAGLGEKRALYEKLVSRQLVGMLLIVIVKKALAPCFTDVRSCGAGSGIMGFMGNKGATAIRLELTPEDSRISSCRPTVLTFVNAHLAASDEMAERRNYDFRELSERLVFAPRGSNESDLPASFARDTYNVYQSDALFWMGDLNYRLDLSDDDIRKLLFSHVSGIDSIQTLLLYDQLRTAMRSNEAFAGFSEHRIAHVPTYRLALGVSKDRLGYDTKRKPAWTDRILYMDSPDTRVTQVAYRSHPEIAMSDHKPVSADFDISLVLIDQPQHENAALALHRQLAGSGDTEHRPTIKIKPTSITFGSVGYRQAVHREVMIQNECDIACVFRFVGTEAGLGNISPSWLRIEPVVGLLQPHEATIILLSAYVDDHSAAGLNFVSPTLECTLILHTALGRDDFLTVSGDYQYTCFGNTLERLTRLAGPIRKLKSPGELVPAEQAINAPREFMRLIDWLMTHVSSAGAFFDYPAQERHCHVIRECLDTGDEFPSESPDGDQRALIAAFASTLVALLDSLVEPVVPARLHAQCLQARDKDEAFEMLNTFPHESINVWIALTAFLHYIARHGDSDSAGPSSADRLASVFAPVLLRDDPTGGHPRVSPVGKRDFLLLFIS